MERWTKERYEVFRQELFSRGEAEYKHFNAKLLRSELPVIGVRVPFLRKTAREIAKGDGIGFLQVCSRETHEERLLYGLVAAALPVSYEAFLPYCDNYTEHLAENWAHCDIFCSSVKKSIKGYEREFFEHIERYLRSKNPWAMRISISLTRCLTENTS